MFQYEQYKKGRILYFSGFEGFCVKKAGTLILQLTNNQQSKNARLAHLKG